MTKNLRIVYRSISHSPFWILAEKTGAWNKVGLNVECSPQTLREKAVDSLKNGSIDIISGNHHNLYSRKAKNGEDFVHLAQVGNCWTENRMVTTKSIEKIADLKGKRVAINKLNSHSGLNVWLFLKQEGLDPDKGEVKLVETRSSSKERWQGVLSGDYDAVFIGIPEDTRAEQNGAKVIPVRPMPMIRGVTLTTTTGFMKSHEDEIRALIKGVTNTIHYFITKKEETLKILKEHVSPILHLESEEVHNLYQQWHENIDRKPYPTLEAIANVFKLALQRNPEISNFNPLILWDTHFVRELDDSGYIDKLYQ